MDYMKHLLLALLLCAVTVPMWAQDDKDDDKDESKYLVGAVPVVDGKVVFSKEFIVTGMSQEKIFERMHKYLADRMKKNNNAKSQVVYASEDKRDIAAAGEEWIVFRSSALALDRTLINYQVTVSCEPGKCIMEIEKIRYTYQEKEKYTAEEWIVDKYALNKAQTKLVRGLAKWRIKTVDFANAWFDGAAAALGAAEAAPVAEKPVAKPSTAPTNAPVVIVPATPVVAQTPVTVTQPAPSVVASPVAANTPAIATGEVPGYTAVAPAQLPKSAIQMGQGGKLVIVIGKDAFNMSMMTADAGGSLGQSSGKPVIFCFLAPEQPYEQMEKAETYTVRYYPANQNEPSIVLDCKKMPAPAPMDGQPRMYVGEILKAWTK